MCRLNVPDIIDFLFPQPSTVNNSINLWGEVWFIGLWAHVSHHHLLARYLLPTPWMMASSYFCIENTLTKTHTDRHQQPWCIECTYTLHIKWVGIKASNIPLCPDSCLELCVCFSSCVQHHVIFTQCNSSPFCYHWIKQTLWYNLEPIFVPALGTDITALPQLRCVKTEKCFVYQHLIFLELRL